MNFFRAVMIVPMILVAVYLFFRLRKLAAFYGLDRRKPWVSAASAALAVAVALQCRSLWGTGTMVVLHIVMISLFMDLIALLARLVRSGLRKGREEKAAGRGEGSTAPGRILHVLYGCGLLPIAAAAAVFVYGFYNINHVRQTEYTVTTEKEIREEGYRVLLITDVHYATIQNPALLAESVERFNGEHPDLVILCGDIVEEGTSKEKMQEVFSVLGGIRSRYGTYYIYGNHDRQPYTDTRTFTDGELAAAIEANGIEILMDRTVEINGELVLAGRDDRSVHRRSPRKTTEELLAGIDRSRFIIVADHQPVQAEENDAAGADLEVSGHTHAGQIWPVGILTELAGVLNYGEYLKGDCRVIVSSGFAGWGYTMRTEEHSEYVLIDIKPE